SYMGVLTKHMYVAPTPPSEIVSASRELGALEDMTLRCLQKKPAQRFQTMADFVEELDRVASVGDDGSVSLRPSEAGGSQLQNLLADELEPPSPEELKLAVRTSTAQASWSSFAVGGVGLVALVSALSWLVLRTEPSSATPTGSAAVVPSSPRQVASSGPTTVPARATVEAPSAPA